MATRSEDHYLLAYVDRALGEVHGAMGEKETAYQHVENALAYFEQIQNRVEIDITENLLNRLKEIDATKEDKDVNVRFN